MHDGGGWTGRRVVVVGAAGGLGEAVAADLVGLGAEVHAIDEARPGVAGSASATALGQLDRDALEGALTRIGAVVDAVVRVGAGGPGDRDALDVLAGLGGRVPPLMPVGGVVAVVVEPHGPAGPARVRALEDWVADVTPALARRGVRVLGLAVEPGSAADPAGHRAHARSLVRLATPDATTLTGLVVPSGPVVRAPRPDPGPLDRDPGAGGSFDTAPPGRGR